MRTSSATDPDEGGALERPTYVSFRLGPHLLAAPVDDVEEVLDLEPVTPLPKAPALLRGVIDVRGLVVPVVDLRLKFGLPPAPDAPEAALVVFVVTLDDEPVLVAGVVDEVVDVFEVDPDAVEPPPKVAGGLDLAYVGGIARAPEGLVLVLRGEGLFSPGELAAILDPAVLDEVLAASSSEEAPPEREPPSAAGR